MAEKENPIRGKELIAIGVTAFYFYLQSFLDDGVCPSPALPDEIG
jgi:hypothetical protein